MTNSSKIADKETFASALGQAVWLMSLSKAHRGQPISRIEDVVTPAIFLQQFKIYFKDKKPIAFISWAAVSDEIKARFDAGDTQLAVDEWRSGKNIVVVECVSPFAAEDQIIKQFLRGVMDRGEAEYDGR
jgi:cytolysin-activating lysine-acyltransferase